MSSVGVVGDWMDDATQGSPVGGRVCRGGGLCVCVCVWTGRCGTVGGGRWTVIRGGRIPVGRNQR